MRILTALFLSVVLCLAKGSAGHAAAHASVHKGQKPPKVKTVKQRKFKKLKPEKVGTTGNLPKL